MDDTDGSQTQDAPTRPHAAGPLAKGTAPSDGTVPFGDACRAWVKVAVHSFGGPAGQIAVLHRVIVDEKRWLDEGRFLRALGYCMVLPGPEAQQLATYVGWRLHGVRGGLVAGGLFILPGFLAILALSVAYVEFNDTPVLSAVFYGLKPAVIAIVLQAVVRLRRRALDTTAATVIAAASFAAMFVFGVPFPLVIVAAAGIACVAFSSPGDLDERAAGAVELDSPGSRRRSLAAAVVALLLWLLPIPLVAILLSPDHVLVQQAVFFSKTAVITFGGAYAVLTYVAEQAVNQFAWVTPAEMLDGLGLAETTPGPLIQVVQFVGFLGAYRDPSGIDPLAAGLLASLITTWVTFAPCFFFIFAGAPFLDSVSRLPRVRAAMRGVTAAVVGVVLNLAIWFSVHTGFAGVRRITAGPLDLEWPIWSTIDLGATSIAAIAAVLALRFEAGLFTILAAGAAAGVLLSL